MRAIIARNNNKLLKLLYRYIPSIPVTYWIQLQKLVFAIKEKKKPGNFYFFDNLFYFFDKFHSSLNINYSALKYFLNTSIVGRGFKIPTILVFQILLSSTKNHYYSYGQHTHTGINRPTHI